MQRTKREARNERLNQNMKVEHCEKRYITLQKGINELNDIENKLCDLLISLQV